MENLKSNLFTAFLAIPLLAAAAPAAPVATPAAATPVESPPPPKSVFVDRPDFGKDPFFPNSKRRGEVVATNRVVEPVANFSNLALKGVSNDKEKPLAIINNKTFEVGEEGEVRVNGLLVKVKVIEIREKSAMVSVNGVTKELFLGQKF
jgi:hypothetical protein